MNVRRFRLWRGLILLVSIISLVALISGIAEAYTISGTVTNNSGKTGRVYLSVQWQGGGDTGFGVSIDPTATTSYSIRGIQQNGSYTVKAFQDTQNSGSPHANDPSGDSAGFNVSGNDVSNVNITLSSPATVGLQPPEGAEVVSGNQGALIMWKPAADVNGKEIATSYKVYWSASQNPGPTNTTGGGSSPDLPSNDKNVYMTSLSNGTLYFAVTAKLNGVESAAVNANSGAPVLIGAPTGGVTVSGTISSSANLSATTPLWIALATSNGPPVYIAPKIAAPSNSQSYTITGVLPGTYQVIAILDMNNNGVIDRGDIDNTEGNGQPITVVNVNYTNANVTLVSIDAQVSATTNHYKQDLYESYSLNFKVRTARKRPVNIAVSGPQLTSIDMGLTSWGNFDVWPGVATRPTLAPPDTYSFAIGYSDGTTTGTSPLTASLTGIVDSFATPISPVGYITYPFSPTDFNWSAPLTPPTPYTYSFWLNNVPNFSSDNYSNMPNSSTTVNYPATYGNGTRYDWSIAVVDSFGNTAQSQTNFISTSAPAINSFTPTSAVPGTTVIINGVNFDTTTTNNTVRFNGALATVTAAASTQLTVTVPSDATTGQISVQNSKGTGSSGFTYFTVMLPLDTQSPSVPTGVTATAVSPYQIDVRWNISTDNVGVTGYKVFRNVDSLPAGQPGGWDNNFWPDYSRTPNTTYTYTVSACDAANNCSAPSSSAQATTLFAPFQINTAGYADLPTALSNVPVDGEIKAQEGLVSLAPPLTLTKGVTLSGGYNSNYTGISGYTTIPGRVNIRGASSKVIFNNIRVK